MINWQFYPKSDEIKPHLKCVVNVFETYFHEVDSKKHQFSSNDVLSKMRPALIDIGYLVEFSKRKEDKIKVPVLFGRNGKLEKYFDADAYNPNEKTVIEVEAGRAGAFDWVHTQLKRDGALPPDFNLVQCLFGEHLLAKYPERVVSLVESEKSALIGAGVFPGYVWLATGGKSQLSADKVKVLRGRTVLMFPDVDAYDLWREKAEEMKAMGINVAVSDLLEKNATQSDRDARIDIADWLIRELQTKAKR